MKKIKTAVDIDEALSSLRKDLIASLESGTSLALHYKFSLNYRYLLYSGGFNSIKESIE